MRRIIVLFLLVVPETIAYVMPLEHQQPTSKIQTDQNERCIDVPSCRKVISDLEAELSKLKGGAGNANKAKIDSLARSLKRNKSKLASLESKKTATQSQGSSTSRGGTEPPPINASPLSSPPQKLVTLSAFLGTEKEKPIIKQVEPTGDVYIVKDVAVGILEIRYDKTVKPNSTFQLKASLTPRNIIEEDFLKEISKVPINCFIKPVYISEKNRAEYRIEESGNQRGKRELKSGEPITWVWRITTSKGFGSDNGTFLVYGRFKVDGQKSDWQVVSRSEIEFKESPLDSIYTYVFNHSTLFITLVSALLTLAGSIIGFLTARKMYSAAKLNNDDMNALQLKLREQEYLLNEKQVELEETNSTKNKLQMELNHLRQRIARILRRQLGKGHWRKLNGRARICLPNGKSRPAEVYMLDVPGTANKLIEANYPLDEGLCLGIKVKTHISLATSITIMLIDS